MNVSMLALTLILGLAGVVHAQAVSPDEARRFFERYVALGDAYDGAIADLYLDTSRITTLRRGPVAGQDRTLEIDGARWRGLVRAAMPVARTRGDRSEFRNVRVEPAGELVRVLAERYAVVKCYWDRGYTMLIGRGPDGGLRIVAEHFETQAHSSC
ncbi:MAG: hypothetical protein ABW020_03920 [Candidatus Rokuibacteriota bacterium]